MKIVVSDDHRCLLDALSTALVARGHDVVALEVTPEAALDAVARHEPDVCLLDFSFPHGNCYDVLRALTARFPGTRVMVFSAMGDAAMVRGLLAAGASGFVSKEASLDDICDVLDRVGLGHVAVDPQLLRQVLDDPSPQDPVWFLQFLTDREWDVLRGVTLGQTTQQIADELGIRHATARTHVQHLLAKLGVHSRLEAAAFMARHATAIAWPVRIRG